MSTYARISNALTALGYPAPEVGQPTDEAMGLIADALEDIVGSGTYQRSSKETGT